jgi:hypothetical protein
LIPEALAEMAPGPELARVLAGIDLSRLSGFDCVRVLKAQYRQSNHERARVLAALVLTRRAAQDQFSLSWDLVTRLPQVHAAMDASVLDEPRARVFSDWTTELSPEQTEAVCVAQSQPTAEGQMAT